MNTASVVEHVPGIRYSLTNDAAEFATPPAVALQNPPRTNDDTTAVDNQAAAVMSAAVADQCVVEGPSVCRCIMTPYSGAKPARMSWGRMTPPQQVIFTLASLLLMSTAVTMITVFQTTHNPVSKRVMLCGMLIIVASSAAAMFAIQRNLGEVVLTMTMFLVLGIFLSSFQDVVYDP
jgi:hypothetical protein